MLCPSSPRNTMMNQYLKSSVGVSPCKVAPLGSEMEEAGGDASVLFARLRTIVLVSFGVSLIPLVYCLIVVSWVQSSSPLLALNCSVYSFITWFVVYLGYKGAVLRNAKLLWAHCVSSLVVTFVAAASVFFFFAPGVLLSHFIATVDFPKDENWWVAIVIFVTVLVLLFVLSVLLVQSANLYTAFLAFVLWRELKAKYRWAEFAHGSCLEAGLNIRPADCHNANSCCGCGNCNVGVTSLPAAEQLYFMATQSPAKSSQLHS